MATYTKMLAGMGGGESKKLASSELDNPKEPMQELSKPSLTPKPASEMALHLSEMLSASASEIHSPMD